MAPPLGWRDEGFFCKGYSPILCREGKEIMREFIVTDVLTSVLQQSKETLSHDGGQPKKNYHNYRIFEPRAIIATYSVILTVIWA